MAILAMCAYSTEDNNKFEYLHQCLFSLRKTVDLTKHKLVIINNSPYQHASDFLKNFVAIEYPNCTLITPNENVGTARGINFAISLRSPGEVVIKCDDDVKWHQKGWVEELEEVFRQDSSIGICGLKRSDITQHPNHDNPKYRTVMETLPNLVKIETCPDIMGTCTAFSPLLLDKVGYMNQCSDYYGFDDVLFSARSVAAGFKNCFLPKIKITHLDEGGTEYTEWKKQEAGVYLNEVSTLCDMYLTKKLSYYYDGGFNE